MTGLLSEDNSDIRLVEDAVRDVWFRDRPPRSEKERLALHEAAMAAVAAYRDRRARSFDDGSARGSRLATDPTPALSKAPICGVVMAECRNEPDHPGDHWHPDVSSPGNQPSSGGPSPEARRVATEADRAEEGT